MVCGVYDSMSMGLDCAIVVWYGCGGVFMMVLVLWCVLMIVLCDVSMLVTLCVMVVCLFCVHCVCVVSVVNMCVVCWQTV